MSGQSVVIVECSLDENSAPISPPEIIRGILDVEKIIAEPTETKYVSSHKWEICNKYYEATVDVCHVQAKNIIDEKFADEVEAVVAIFDSRKDADGLKSMSSWLSYFDIWQPEIKLAVCRRCSSIDDDSSEHISRETIQHWCLDNEFELVELDPVVEDYGEYEDFGMTRIRKALSAHMWPKMDLKDQNKPKEAAPDEQLALSESKEDGKINIEDPPAEPSIEERIDALLPPSDQFDDDFETLFQKMHVFKESAANMAGSSRKDYAEKVVTAFWKAIGGEEDELGELSSDEDR